MTTFEFGSIPWGERLGKCKRVRLGVVGAGRVFRKRLELENFKSSDVEIVAVCNKTHSSGSRAAREYSIPVVEEDWKAVTTRTDVDAIYVGVPPALKAKIILNALENDKHVICEPPLAFDLNEARSLEAAAKRKTDLVCALAPTLRRRDNFEFVRHLLSSGAIGRVTAVDVLHTSRADLDTKDWRQNFELSGRAILDICSITEILNDWVGHYLAVSAVLSSPSQDAQKRKVTQAGQIMPEIAMIIGTLDNGSVGVEYHGGLSPDLSTPRDLVSVYGLEGVLRYYFDTGRLLLAKKNEHFEELPTPKKHRHEVTPFRDFAQAVGQSTNPTRPRVTNINSFKSGVNVMRRLEGIHRSNLAATSVSLSSV